MKKPIGRNCTEQGNENQEGHYIVELLDGIQLVAEWVRHWASIRIRWAGKFGEG
jgi:hypothetical protein